MKRLKTFIILWSTQSLSQLSSSMTSFVLTLWMYQQTGSALQTSLLTICSYAPYVIMSIFAGAFSDRWDKKKTMLSCDSFAACTTIAVLVLLKLNILCPVHLYVLNAVNGLMNTLQQPASDVAMSMIIPKEDYQKTSGLRSFSQSLITILNSILATALFTLGGMEIVIYIDLITFAIAFIALLCFIHIPKIEQHNALKNRIRVIYITMLISLSIENFILAFCNEPYLWCLGQFTGWLVVPIMSANLDVILRSTIPVSMQGRVYACRNTLQYFTIPIGFLWGGFMVDNVCEPLIARSTSNSLLVQCFGHSKGAGAAIMMLILGILGTVICLVFGQILKKYSFEIAPLTH